ncbi:MAG: FAD-binding oxidoreductase [Eubacterium sp.]|nr:FAD-binding oxidoreductase [Eubacterium sp.]
MKPVMSADIVIIGGGVMGTATAYELTKAGLDVVLCEMRNLGSGASGRCGGMICHCYGRENNLDRVEERLKLTRYNTEMLKKTQEELDIDYHVRITGLLDVWINEEEAEEGKRLYEMEAAKGFTDEKQDIKLLDRKETLEVMPTLNPDLVYGSRFRQEDGNLSPYQLCQSLGWGAQKKGAKILTHTKVDKIVIEDDKVCGVETDKGYIACKWVLNAANGWAKNFGGETSVITPIREIACVTEPIGPVPPMPFEMQYGGQFAYGGTQTATGNITIGGPAHPREKRVGFYNETIWMDEVRRLGNYMTGIFPKLKDVKMIRSWVGTMGFVPDAQPMIGKSTLTEGLLIAAGFVAGISLEFAVARIIKELITLGEVEWDIDMSLYDPGRFLNNKDWAAFKWPYPRDIGISGDYSWAYKQGKGDEFQIPYDLTAKR